MFMCCGIKRLLGALKCQDHNNQARCSLVPLPWNCSVQQVLFKDGGGEVKSCITLSQPSDKPVQPWMITEKGGVLHSACCQCMAGLGQTCTHVTAMLFIFETMGKMQASTTVTEVLPEKFYSLCFANSKITPAILSFQRGIWKRKRVNSLEEDSYLLFQIRSPILAKEIVALITSTGQNYIAISNSSKTGDACKNKKEAWGEVTAAVNTP